MVFEMIEENMNRDRYLSKYACLNINSIRLVDEVKDFRPDYFRDVDRIIYSLSYTRYIDKTQVFSNNTNDNISKRMTHVQIVSKIARTIGRALNLNEDLIEAIALGHDIGHVPFGHVGEHILNDISLKHDEGFFYHNIQSVRTMMSVENNGVGNNLTVQVLDGIMCHNGILSKGKYYPQSKTKEDFLRQYNNAYHIKEDLVPMTLEGCVVRISDIIGYIGRDIEDAIMLNRIKIEDIPKSITKVLGLSNRDIVNTVVNDIIKNSLNKPYLLMSDDVFEAIIELKKFNNEHIYLKANSKDQIEIYTVQFNSLFEKYLNDLKIGNNNSDIYTVFLNNMDKNYENTNTKERIVIDYIAGMTDDYFKKKYKEHCEKCSKVIV